MSRISKFENMHFGGSVLQNDSQKTPKPYEIWSVQWTQITASMAKTPLQISKTKNWIDCIKICASKRPIDSAKAMGENKGYCRRALQNTILIILSLSNAQFYQLHPMQMLETISTYIINVPNLKWLVNWSICVNLVSFCKISPHVPWKCVPVFLWRTEAGNIDTPQNHHGWDLILNMKCQM